MKNEFVQNLIEFTLDCRGALPEDAIMSTSGPDLEAYKKLFDKKWNVICIENNKDELDFKSKCSLVVPQEKYEALERERDLLKMEIAKNYEDRLELSRLSRRDQFSVKIIAGMLASRTDSGWGGRELIEVAISLADKLIKELDQK